jgi:hypothetical protein
MRSRADNRLRLRQWPSPQGRETVERGLLQTSSGNGQPRHAKFVHVSGVAAGDLGLFAGSCAIGETSTRCADSPSPNPRSHRCDWPKLSPLRVRKRHNYLCSVPTPSANSGATSLGSNQVAPSGADAWVFRHVRQWQCTNGPGSASTS